MSKKKSIFKWTVGICISLIIGVNGFSWWVLNATDKAFGNGGNETVDSLKNDIAEGAGYFLESYTNTLSFMKKTELSVRVGINPDELKALLNTASMNMELAKGVYIRLKQTADGSPYSPSTVDYLVRFDYESFRAANDMSPEVFSSVKEHLVKGDTRKLYDDMLSNIENILVLLKQAREKVEAGVFPPAQETWKLNQAFSRALLYGQYAAQVFGSM